ncbi:MAG: hypothetical protein SynsKO_07630 [Synoicihabitans sp.]
MNSSLQRSLLLLGFLLTVPLLSANEDSRPNILLILADDLGYADVSFNGPSDIRTPQMDELAHDGMIFKSAYVVHPFCGPSRMALFSGRYPYEFGAPYNLPDYSSGNYRDQGMPKSETLISNVLQDAGYQTGLIGKWHLGTEPHNHPNVRGFDDFYGFLGGGILYFGPYRAQNEQGRVWDYKVNPEHNGVDDDTLTAEDYMTDVLTDKGVDFINHAAQQEDPFFLFMSYNAPHTVLAAKQEDIALYPELEGKRQVYAAMVHSLDEGVGRLVESLKAVGEFENTLIIFLSDNGGRTDQGADNAPLSGAKGDTWEGGFRTPMFMHWPEKIPSGSTYEHAISALDFYPTFAQLAEAKIPASKDLDGKAVMDDILAGEDARPGEIIYTIRHRNGFTDVGILMNEWKAVRYRKQWKLFNLANDISEDRDLSAKHPNVLSHMISAVAKETKTHPRPLWFDNPKAEKMWDDTGMPNHAETYRN